ncbi:metallophosphoesterase family protein [Solirubrobacter soli]|uniref:metallophosphoesterase family protein n=1 Tax=Solirubrobacter soli TaxID=363832 RepID=UPI000424E903|nr:metallophosphoesterase family protein [Solirubrobacter soli]
MRHSLLAAGLAAALLMPAVAGATPRDHDRATTLAVIGDVPYGDPLIAEFPEDITEINADPDVSRVIHLGDIKNGSSRCDTSYLTARLADFQTFADPLVYTPGDNEWTDCHRANNGGYNPVERLSVIRQLFFPRPGRTLGHDKEDVAFQSRAYPENVAWSERGVVYGTVHVVGSNDDRAAWFTDRKDAPGNPLPETRKETGQRTREYTKREAANLDWLDALFDAAERTHAPALVIGMQADMWDPTAEQSAFEPVKAVIAERAEEFGKPVLLMEGDSHLFLVDRPVGMPANLTRIVVQGSTNLPHEWTKLKVDPSRPSVFSCHEVEFVTKKVTPCPGPLAP